MTEPSPYFAKYKEEFNLAAQALLHYLPNDPNNTQIHYDIADALYHAEADKEEADEHARRALELDEIARRILADDPYAPILARKLTDPQRRYLEQRIGIPRE
jgi:hypothetical protein